MNTAEPKIKPTKKHAAKLVELLSHGLVSGLGKPRPGEMCVEAAVCFALGLPHSDDPKCVSPAVRQFKISLNDSDWSSNTARAQGMLKLAVAQLGSDCIDDRKFCELLALKTIQRLCPRLFRLLAELTKESADKQVMEEAAVFCEGATDLVSAVTRLTEFLKFALALARAHALARALDLAREKARDEALGLLADIALEVLIELKSPGCKWLPLCEGKETK